MATTRFFTLANLTFDSSVQCLHWRDQLKLLHFDTRQLAKRQMEEDQKKNQHLPTIPVKLPWSSYTYAKTIQESPYKALVGVVIDGRVPERLPQYPRYRVRNQTGLTNRWRLPQSLYGDMLGTAQTLKAVNMPFNHTLVGDLSHTHPSMNPMLLSCLEFADVNEKNWSLLKKSKVYKPSADDEDPENHLPAV